ncbi:hypothetical protein B0T20DRAFT_471668 [Sordaria brevicollis]|uniref:Uncharacterized protein n=1 Tax=Sordaria brevicollis TaxID=83679 RepID=A0AAE0P8V0_SORBR|nr:hypothetical protein B0T20DRAFT_471668 [Sordaria brevicollis]
MADFYGINQAFGEISRRLAAMNRTSMMTLHIMRRISGRAKERPNWNKLHTASFLIATVLAISQILIILRSSGNPPPPETLQQPEYNTMAATSHAKVDYARTAQQQRRNTHGRPLNQRLSNGNYPCEISIEGRIPPITHLFCNMFGLHPHEVALAYNAVAAWFRGVGWE